MCLDQIWTKKPPEKIISIKNWSSMFQSQSNIINVEAVQIKRQVLMSRDTNAQAYKPTNIN